VRLCKVPDAVATFRHACLSSFSWRSCGSRSDVAEAECSSCICFDQGHHQVITASANATHRTSGNHRTTEPDSGPIACSSASGTKTKSLHWPTAPADWHTSGALYRTTASSCKSGNLFLAQRLHSQAQTVPVNLGYLPHRGRAHASHHLRGHLHNLQNLSAFALTLTLSLLRCLLYHLLHYFRICKEAAAMACSVRTSVGQKHRTLYAFTK